MAWGSRQRYGYPAAPPLATFGGRAWQRMVDTLHWLMRTREVVDINITASPTSGGTAGTTTLNGGSPAQIPFNHAFYDPWNIAHTDGDTSNIVIRRSDMQHCNGWWVWALQANLRQFPENSRLFIDIVCLVGDVRHYMSRYEVGNSQLAGYLSDHLICTSFCFDFSRFDPANDVQIICEMYTDDDGAAGHEVNFIQLTGMALAWHPPANLTPATYRYAAPTRWTAGALTSGMVNSADNNLLAMAADRIVCDLEHPSSETVPVTTVTTLANWAEVYDPWGWHSMVTNPSRITVDAQTTGVALIMAAYAYEVSMGGGAAQMDTAFGIQKNGLTMVQEQTVQTDLPGGLYTWVGTIVNVSPGDYFTTVVYHDHNGTQEVGTLNMGAWFVARFVLVMLTGAAYAGTTSWATPDEITAGDVITPTIYNKVPDGGVYFAKERVGARCVSSVARTLTHNTWTVATLDTEKYDNGGLHTGTNGYFTIPSGSGGYYLVSANAAFSGGDGTYGLRILVNGVGTLYKFTTSKSGPMLCIPPTPLWINSNQTVQLELFQFNATATTRTYGAAETTGYGCCLAVQHESFGSA